MTITSAERPVASGSAIRTDTVRVLRILPNAVLRSTGDPREVMLHTASLGNPSAVLLEPAASVPDHIEVVSPSGTQIWSRAGTRTFVRAVVQGHPGPAIVAKAA